MPNDRVTPPQKKWRNWSGNIHHSLPTSGEQAYFYPKDPAELKAVVANAKAAGVTLSVSGQRHSQAPLVAVDNSAAPPTTAKHFLVDMACYCDIGTTGMKLGPGPNQVTVNPGVREDNLDAFLTQNNLMMRTVTAGGFFSLGGMTAVDVHGGTVAAPIFAETASAFTILGADGTETTIDASTPVENGWSPLQFARVSLGGLGIVTRIVLDVMPRPYATTLRASQQKYELSQKSDFVQRLDILLNRQTSPDRMEIFFDPYAASSRNIFLSKENVLVLAWHVDDDPAKKIPNQADTPPDACTLAGKNEFGAPELGGIAKFAWPLVRDAQYSENAFDSLPSPVFITNSGIGEISKQMEAATAQHSDLWLTAAAQVMFMSYFIELPDLGPKGLGMVWDGLQAAASRTVIDGAFHVVAPLEFRFIRGGDSAMSGTYTDRPGATFVNLDLIGFTDAVPSDAYPDKLLRFFADVERDWVAMGGVPHNGKMYGFYDPAQPEGHHTAAFNPGFLNDLRRRRGQRLQAYAAYRKKRDPGGLFYNDYLRQLLEG